MKKTLVIIALVLVAVLCVPSVPALAAADSVQIKTFDSVDGFYSDTDMNNAQKYVTGYKSSNTNVNPSMSTLYGYLNSYEWDSSKDLYIIFISRYSDTLTVWEMDSELVGDAFSVVSPTSLPATVYPNNNYTMLTFFNLSRQVWYAGRSGTLSLNVQSPTWSYSNDGVFVGNNSGIYIRSDTQEEILDSNIPVYFNWDIVQKGGSAVTDSNKTFYSADKSSYTNFLDPSLPYTNENDETVSPDNGVEFESNENHMYLKSCDVGFCKPYSSSDLSSAGGGYLYVNYTYDNWINSHSSDYWVNIRTVVNVDGTQFSGINTRALDLNGVNVLTFKESTVPNNWTDEGLLFVEFPNTVVSTYKAGYVYSIPYPTFANTDSGGISNRSRFLSNGRNRLFLTPSGGRGYDITNESLGDFLQSIFNVNVHQKFTLTVTVWLQDTNNNRSGEFTKSFNLITGVGTTTDTGITDNDNPFEPDPMLPDIPDGSGNDSNSVAPIVNNFMINGSGTIGYDPGYRDLKEDIDKDPDGNFSQYLDPMQNDDVGSWFMSFVDEMPTEMKSILIAGVGVGVLFGLYRFIRRG